MSNAVELAPFDYDCMPRSLQHSLSQHEMKIRERFDFARDQIIPDIGEHLLQAREELRQAGRHGELMAWVTLQLGMDYSTAENYMHVAEYRRQFGTIPRLASLRALYKLTAPSTPEVVKREVAEGRITPRTEKDVETAIKSVTNFSPLALPTPTPADPHKEHSEEELDPDEFAVLVILDESLGGLGSRRMQRIRDFLLSYGHDAPTVGRRLESWARDALKAAESAQR